MQLSCVGALLIGNWMYFTVTIYLKSQDWRSDLIASPFFSLLAVAGVAAVAFGSIRLMGSPDWYEAVLLAGIGTMVLALIFSESYQIGDWKELVLLCLGAIVVGGIAGGAAVSVIAVAGILLASVAWNRLTHKMRWDRAQSAVSHAIQGTADRWIFHPVLQVVLFLRRRTPLSYQRFLDHMKDGLLLKAGSATRYEFVHRLLRDHFAIRELTPDLEGSNLERKLNAVNRLAFQGEAAFDPLRVLADSMDARVRAAAVAGLSRLAVPDVAVILKNMLRNDPDSIVRCAIVDNQGRLSPTEYLELCDIAIRDHDASVRSVVARNARDSQLVDFLFDDREPEVVYHVARRFERRPYINQETIFLHTTTPSHGSVIDGVSDRLARDSAYPIRAAGIEVLQATRDPASAKRIIRVGMDDPHPNVRLVATQSLGVLGDAEAVPVLTERIRGDPIEGQSRRSGLVEIFRRSQVARLATLRAAAATALGRIGDERCVPTLRQVLHKDDASIGVAAATALGAIGGADAFSVLKENLNNPVRNVRDAAVEALGGPDAPEIVPKLLQVLADTGGMYRRHRRWSDILDNKVSMFAPSAISGCPLTLLARRALFARVSVAGAARSSPDS